MKLFSLLFRQPSSGRSQNRPLNLRAQLALNGIEQLEDRIQPAAGSSLRGFLAHVGPVVSQVREGLNNAKPKIDDRIHNSVGPALRQLLAHGAPAGQGKVADLVQQVLKAVKPAKGGSGSTDVATASISGNAFTDWNFNSVRDEGEDADTGVTVTLTGADNLGNAVSTTVSVDENGAYSFTGLRAGNYSLTFSSSSSSGNATIGSAGGSQNAESSSTIDGIVLTSNTQASGYDYAVAPMLS